MTALAQTVFIDGVKFDAGTDHTAIPAAVVDRIRNPNAWVGGTAPPLSRPVIGKTRITTADLSNPTRGRAALGAVAIDDPRVTAVTVPAATRVFVSRNAGSPNQSNGTDTGMNTQAKHTALVSTSGLTVAYANIWNNNGVATANGNDITVRAAISKDGTNWHPVWFSGRRDAVIEPAGMSVGEVGVSLTAGEVFFSRTFVTCASSGKFPLSHGEYLNGTDEGAVAGTSDLTTSGSVTANFNAGYFPFAFFGRSSSAPRAIGFIGDSIGAGRGDNAFWSGGGGWIVRALGAQIPWARPMAFSGAQAVSWAGWGATGAGVGRRLLQMPRYSSVICELGINDVTIGAVTLSQAQARLQEVWRVAAATGAKIYQSTLTPSTTSTDSWATAGNQTKNAAETVRVALNDWIRTQPTGLAGYIEAADAVETARNSGLWKSDGSANTFTADGVHPSAAGHALIAATVNLAKFN